jgi:hypothetical protein
MLLEIRLEISNKRHDLLSDGLYTNYSVLAFKSLNFEKDLIDLQ